MHLIYRLGILIAILVSSLTTNGQNKSHRIYEDFANKEGITHFTLSRNMINVVNLTLDDENKSVSGDLHEIKVLFFNPEKGNLKNSFSKIVNGKLKRMNYREVENDCKDQNTESRFWIRGSRKHVKECHVVLAGTDKDSYGCLVSFYGDMDVKDLDVLEALSREQIDL